MWLTVERADAVIVKGKLFQLRTAVKTLHFGNVIIIKGGPAQVDQFIQIDQFGNPLAVEIQRRDLVRAWSHKCIITGFNRVLQFKSQLL